MSELNFFDVRMLQERLSAIVDIINPKGYRFEMYSADDEGRSWRCVFEREDMIEREELEILKSLIHAHRMGRGMDAAISDAEEFLKENG